MNKFYLMFLTAFVYSGLCSQSFSDDFESYTAGDLIAVANSDWTTWSNSPGGTDDCEVSDSQAYTGNNSLYLMSESANGGPDDIVLPFGGEYSDGEFALEFYMYVDDGYGGYFNIQGTDPHGNDWAMDAYFIQDGNLLVYSDAASIEQLTGTFPLDTWFKVNVDVNLADNVWEVSIDDTSLGTFSNGINSVASLNLYPWNGTDIGGNGEASYYVDDISFDVSQAISTEEEEEMIESIGVYPNPSTGKVNIEIDSACPECLTVLDINGREIETGQIRFVGDNSLEIDLSELESGIYLVKYTNGNQTLTSRLVLE